MSMADTLALFLDLLFGAMALEAAAFEAVANRPAALSIAIGIVILAGLSEMTSQTLMLWFSRAALFRVIASLLLTALTYLGVAATWTVCLWAATRLVGPGEAQLSTLFAVVALSFAPRVFSFAQIAPYFGTGIERLLDAWTLACIVYGITVVFETGLAPAVVTGLAGWGVSLVLRGFFGKWIGRWMRTLRRLVVGTPLEMSPDALIQGLRHDGESGRRA